MRKIQQKSKKKEKFRQIKSINTKIKILLLKRKYWEASNSAGKFVQKRK